MDRAHPTPPVAPAAGRLIWALLGAAAVAALASAPAVDAQEAPPAVAPDSARVQAQTQVQAPRGVSPRGAFLRAAALPGWGHASIGAYHRGAFYFLVESASAWMLVKTRRRFTDVERRLRFEEDLLRADLFSEGVTDEAEIRKRLDGDATLEDLRDLREARRQQREDWTAASVFLVLLSGVDAYVSAHLRDFPAPLSLEAVPVGNGRVEISLGVNLPR